MPKGSQGKIEGFAGSCRFVVRSYQVGRQMLELGPVVANPEPSSPTRSDSPSGGCGDKD